DEPGVCKGRSRLLPHSLWSCSPFRCRGSLRSTEPYLLLRFPPSFVRSPCWPITGREIQGHEGSSHRASESRDRCRRSRLFYPRGYHQGNLRKPHTPGLVEGGGDQRSD